MPDFKETVDEFLREYGDPNKTVATTPAVGRLIEAEFGNIRVWSHPAFPPDTMYLVTDDELQDIKDYLAENGWL